MASIQLENVTKRFNDITAIDRLDLEINDGEFFCILGPPGAGKTTLLRSIVGLEIPDEGEIKIDGTRVNAVHPSKRDISMIFQNLALYPDKTIFENIAFPLRQRKVNEAEIKSRVEDVATLLKIDWLLHKLPSQLSGGERQRVAIGRAIIRKPKAYLMDEPLSNLDALLRLEMRVGLKDLQTRLNETFVYVTHDQDEALSMGDRLSVLNRGVLQQVADPVTIYQEPDNMFVATILGNPPMNFLNCTLSTTENKIQIRHETFVAQLNDTGIASDILGKTTGGQIILGIRPEDIKIYDEPPDTSAIGAQIYVTEPLGSETIVDVKLGTEIIKVIAEPDYSGEVNQTIWLTFDAAKIHLFNQEKQDCIFHCHGKVPVDFQDNRNRQ